MKFITCFGFFLIFISPMILSDGLEINQTQTVNFISDYINDLNSPSFISAFVCLSQENLTKIYKNVLRHGKYFSLSIYKTFNPITYMMPLNDQMEKCHKLLIVDMRCNGSMTFLQQSDSRFPSPFRWLLLEENFDNEITAARYRNFSFFINSDVKLARMINDSFVINPMYRITAKDSMIIEDYETLWTNHENRGKFIQKQQYKTLFERRSNLQKTLLTASFVIMDNDTLNHLTDYKNLPIDPSTKKNYIYMQHVTKFLNASFTFTHANLWGTKAENYTVGILGNVVRGEADLSGNGLLMRSDEVNLVLYLVPVGETSLSFLFRQPSLTYTADLVTLSFDTSLWIATFIAIIVMGVILFVTAYWEWIICKRSKNDAGYIEILTVALTAFCQQGTIFEPKKLSERVVLFVTFLATTFLYTAYSANIVVLLTSPSTAIKTLDDLLNSKLTMGMEDTPYNYFYFKASGDPKLREFWDKKISPPGEKPHAYEPTEGIEKVRQGHFAYGIVIGTGYRLINQLFQEHEKCGLTAISYVDLKYLWLSAPKNTTYGELFKTIFRKMHERGIMLQGRLRVFAGKPQCGGTGNMFVTVTLDDMETAFFVLGFGMGMAIIILIFEILYDKHIDKKIDKIPNVKFH